MLAALCAVLGYVSLDMVTFKLTFESLPVLISALLFGPLHGALVGAVGTFIYQILRYGFTATTLLWMLPYILCGCLTGLYAKKRSFCLGKAELVILVFINEFVITVLNTSVIFIDSKLFNYYYPTIITGSLVVRLIACVIRSVLFSIVLYPLLAAVRKYSLDRSGK